MTNDLPQTYPFIPNSSIAYPGALEGSEMMIREEARSFAREDLRVEDFECDPEHEEDKLNAVLTELRRAVRAVGETLAQPGPWHGIKHGDDAALAAAEIKALMQKLIVPAQLVEDTLVEARLTALERQRDTAKYEEGTRWRAHLDFEDRVTGAIRSAAGEHQPVEYRLTFLDLLIAEAQRYRATLAGDHLCDTN